MLALVASLNMGAPPLAVPASRGVEIAALERQIGFPILRLPASMQLVSARPLRTPDGVVEAALEYRVDGVVLFVEERPGSAPLGSPPPSSTQAQYFDLEGYQAIYFESGSPLHPLYRLEWERPDAGVMLTSYEGGAPFLISLAMELR